tara:strand:- start:1555 stop:1782 length:228 start_codon:yes stop_codon:yes gene_type:complete
MKNLNSKKARQELSALIFQIETALLLQNKADLANNDEDWNYWGNVAGRHVVDLVENFGIPHYYYETQKNKELEAA